MNTGSGLCRPRQAAALVVLTAFALLAHGRFAEASLQCKLYQWRNEKAHYETTYRYSAEQTKAARETYAPLPKKGVYAIVRLYEIAPEATTTKPCKNLALTKRLFLQRIDDPTFVFREVIKFYADDGTLVATNIQDISEQLSRTGYYMAANPLPIPEDAPPGRYQLVSELVLTKKGRSRTFLLATARTEYEILPPD
ncbi:MAG: hypothetical protein BMS9Abin10_0610 [Gammaproteobacteria bacterium]|nr:MAG: hypothetical protein BMS9Abin10_0610 [Gammaproteobacteria bacterium]